jgi:hypothetical protein
MITATAGTGGQITPAPNTMTSAAVIASWPAKPQELARTLIAKYGEPQEMTPSHLIWLNNGPWKKTILYRDEIPHNFPKPHTDLLEQVIDYRVPAGRFDNLATFDGSVIVERTKGTIAARCDKEEMNFLALNLANDVAQKKRSAEDARRYYARAAMEFMQGKPDPYTQGLQFTVQHGGTGDPDAPMTPEGAEGTEKPR